MVEYYYVKDKDDSDCPQWVIDEAITITRWFFELDSAPNNFVEVQLGFNEFESDVFYQVGLYNQCRDVGIIKLLSGNDLNKQEFCGAIVTKESEEEYIYDLGLD